jgi:uncharacterized protein (DUF362 family)
LADPAKSTEPAPRSVVALHEVRGDVRAAIRAALEDVEWRRVLPRGEPVALKVNLGWDLFIPGSITSPLFVEALIREIQPHVGAIHVVEADQVLEDVEKAFAKSGMKAVCERTGATWVNMTRGTTTPVDAPRNVVLKRIDVPRILREARLVTVPVMKTHAKTRLSGALKNQWGCLSTMRHSHHLELDDALADLNSVLRPVLSVMDGTVALEGNGPKSGRSRVADRVLASTDPVALDTVQAICMGLDPKSVVHLQRCADRGIGTNERARIDVRGLVPEKSALAFTPAKHNAVSFLETILRRSSLKRLVFDSPLFKVALVGAKLYYRVWTLLAAEPNWRRVREHPLYGSQWSSNWRGLA